VSITRTAARRLAVAALVLCSLAAVLIGALVATATGTPRVAAPAPVEAVAPAPAPVVVADPNAAYTADDVFLADLLGPDTDVTPAQRLQLVELAHRYCDKVVTGVGAVPGAEVQTREGWLAGLTVPGDPHAFTMGEAGKLLDTAEAAYCPNGR
jgi:hypothetical protein